MTAFGRLATLRRKAPPPDLPQYSESLLSEVGFGMAPVVAIRRGGFKWIRVPKPELYDLRRDFGETANLAGQQANRAGELKAISRQDYIHVARDDPPPFTLEGYRRLLGLVRSTQGVKHAFVSSGIRFDLQALVGEPSTLLRVPLFLVILLIVRGLPTPPGRITFVPGPR